jgi:hypothetical protein
MLRAHCLSAGRICVLIASIVLWGATVADPSRALASSYSHRTASSLPAAGVSAPAARRVSKPRASRRKSSPARGAECAAAARAGKPREARKACVVKKAKTKGTKPKIASKRWSLVRPFSPAPASTDTEVPGSEFGPFPEPAGSSPELTPVSEPVGPGEPDTPEEPTPPAKPTEPVAPVEPAPPVEPATPEEPTPPAESIEPVAPVEPTPPEEPTPPSEPTEPVVPSEPTPPVEPTPPEEPVPPVEPAAPEEPAAPFRFFSPMSFWNEALPTSAPLDPSSAAVVGAFEEEVTREEAAKKGPFINTTAWSVPIYTVPVEQPTVKVTLVGSRVSPALRTAWEAVPLPEDAHPATGTDKHLVVWQPSTDRLWEFWQLEQVSTGWQAEWGGAIEKVSSDSGAYGPEAWPGARFSWGASASSLSIAGGLITLEDLEMGQINHALAMALPDVRARVYALPAQRTDGGDTEPLSLPEGAHLRLDPSLDLASLHLPRLTLMMAEAAQRYGIIVRDSAANVAFYAQDPTPTGANPYIGTHGYFEGKSSQKLLESFPWTYLQLLKMELHSAS